MPEEKILSFVRSAGYYQRKADRLRESDPENALVCYHHAMESDPTNPMTALIAAKTYMEHGQYRLGMKVLARACALPGAPAESLFLMGECLFHLRFHTPALTALTMYLRIESDGENAKRAFLRMISLNSHVKWPDRHEWRARRFALRAREAQIAGRLARAARLYEESLTRLPCQPSVRAAYANLLLRLERPHDAMREARKTPLGQSVFYRAAKRYLGPIDPNRTDPGLLCDLGRYEDALHQARQLLAVSPWNTRLLHVAALSALRAGLPECEYEALWRKLSRVEPDSPAPETCRMLAAAGRGAELSARRRTPCALGKQFREAILRGTPDLPALAWGLRREKLALRAATLAQTLPFGERALRDVLADPYVPAYQRAFSSRALMEMHAQPPFVGLTPAHFWINGAEEPRETGTSAMRLKLLRTALQRAEGTDLPMGMIFFAWLILIQSPQARSITRDVDTWADIILHAVSMFSDKPHHCGMVSCRVLRCCDRLLRRMQRIKPFLDGTHEGTRSDNR